MSFLMIVNTGLELFSIAIVLQLIQLIDKPELVHSHAYIKLAYDGLGFSSPNSFLLAVSLAFLFVFIIKNAFYLYFVSFQSKFAYFGAASLGRRFFESYLRAPYEFHLRHNSAELHTRIGGAVEQIYTNTLSGYVTLAAELMVIIAIMTVLVWAEPTVTLGVGVILGACFIGLYAGMHGRMAIYGQLALKYVGQMTQWILQGLGSIKEMKVLGCEDYFVEACDDARRHFAKVQFRSAFLSSLPRVVIETLVVGGIVIVIAIVIIQQRGTEDIIGALGLFAAAAFRIMPSMNRILLALGNIRRCKYGVELLHSDMLQFEKNNDVAIGRNVAPLSFANQIAVENICFTYAAGAAPVLSNVSFSIKRGESIGIVGPSGAGKSTLVDIMLGLLPPSSGRVLVDGHDVVADPTPWRRLIGYVPQSVAITDDKLMRNVAFGVPKAEIDDAQVWKALSMARLDDFCRSLPEGPDTMLGEDGVRLSGGQRQRIGIARALYRNPDVLFMDEATSSLDGETERDITTAIESLRGEKTMIIIAHRLSTVRRCDRVVILENGKVADIGSFDELLARCAGFRHMVKLAEMVAEAPEDLSALAQSS